MRPERAGAADKWWRACPFSAFCSTAEDSSIVGTEQLMDQHCVPVPVTTSLFSVSAQYRLFGCTSNLPEAVKPYNQNQNQNVEEEKKAPRPEDDVCAAVAAGTTGN